MRSCVAALAALLLAWSAQRAQPDQAAVQQRRNLGKAFYENPTTQQQAVEEFRKLLALLPDSPRERVNYGLALLRAGKTADGIAELQRAQRQDPSIPHTWFVLGVEFKKAGDYRRAAEQFERMVRLVPEEPISHFNLGYLYHLAGRAAEARAEFEKAAALDPGFAAPHFQLFNLARDGGRADDAAREQAIFLRLKREQADASTHEDVDWSRYAEIVDPIEPPTRDDAPRPAPAFRDTRVGDGVDAASAGALVLDADGDGRPDAIVWSRAGARLLLHGDTPVAASGLGALTGVRSIAAGDYDNDGLPDLCVLSDAGAVLLHNQRGVFAPASSTFPAGPFDAAVWVDYDHDYDLDLLLLGSSSVLFRNNGPAGFSDQTRDLPLPPGHAAAAAVFNVIPDQPGHDLAVAYADRTGVILRDRLAGGYEAQPLPALAAGARTLAVADVDADGADDLLAAYADAIAVIRNQKGRFEIATTVPARGTITLADFDNRGDRDLIAGGSLLRHAGAAVFTPSAASPLPAAAATLAADFDQDGRVDLLSAAADGSAHFLRNETATPHHWLTVRLVGVKNLLLAPEAQVEVKAGALYQKRRYTGTPLTFGLGAHTAADVVRITWPNGLIQNAIAPPIDAVVTYKEAPRLSGSCPMIFTWDGRGFRFITDVLGVAPLGASAGDGTFFPVDDHEYVRIPGAALVPRGAAYDVRITEELREVSYLDQVQLVAVDHARAIDVFANDKFKSPPFPEFRLFGVAGRLHASAAHQGGRDVRRELLAEDGVYAEHFVRDYAGVAETHTLDLDFAGAAPGNRALLVLNGWVDWADGSTFRAASQRDRSGLITPYLQVKDGGGRWTTVIEDMGMPAGKPKTIVVDLTGKFLSASREVRIVTNLCVYWDEIYLAGDASPPPVRLTRLSPATADLRFRGFSRATIDPERRRPESFDYSIVSPTSMWNPTPGSYTRYGDVVALLTDADDRLVIMGSGDEVRLQFDAASLPPLPAEWTRDFLLLVGGWAKDADANTAFSQSVEPLPFHRMSAYPYPARESYPDDAAHREYRETYNVRPALRLVRPLHDR